MIQDELLVKAVSRVKQRSEKQDDLQKLVGTFVDVGILPQLDNRNAQIFYGRRGTGKTHVLRVLGSRLAQEDSHNTVVYIDARTLGSTEQFTDEALPIGRRCLALFQDILVEIFNALLEHIVEHPSAKQEQALNAADDLSRIMLEPIKEYREERLTARSTEKVGGTSSRTATVSASVDTVPRVNAALGERHVLEEQQVQSMSASYKVSTDDKVIFPALHAALSSALNLSESYLYILIDEWSSLPADIQPYLAEFLKRGVLPLQRATLKIGSLEYRSRFEMNREGARLVGFEVGADIAATQDLDDYYVFDRNPEKITAAYADMLLRHLSSELPENYVLQKYGIERGSDLTSRLFTARTFQELARASEGVVRDLINIFTIAYFNAHRRGREDIDRKAILEAARHWFEQDKERQLDEHLERVLRRIVDEVIGNKRARSFLLPRELERDPTIQRLFDARVLHQMQRGYADKDKPGVRYNIYTLDYGTYVTLLGTSKEPQMELAAEDDAANNPELVVPFDDKRSIRRIVLNADVLS